MSNIFGLDALPSLVDNRPVQEAKAAAAPSADVAVSHVISHDDNDIGLLVIHPICYPTTDESKNSSTQSKCTKH